MQDINYDMSYIKQYTEDCVQAAASQILKFYGVEKTVEEIKNEVPIYISKSGIPLGSSIGHIATYFIHQGFKVTLHTVDIEIFDRSWVDLDSSTLSTFLEKRKRFIRHPRFDNNAFDLIFDGYKTFLANEGKVAYPIISEAYLYKLLVKGPVYAVVSRTFLNQTFKRTGKSGDDWESGSTQGHTSTHVVVVAGYKEGQFKIIDSDYEFGGIRWIDTTLLIGSIYLAETEFDSLVITLEK